MRSTLAFLVILTALACASSQMEETSPEEAAIKECDGVWSIQVTNMLSERVRVFYWSRHLQWVWLGTVYPTDTWTYSLPPERTMAQGRNPRLRVASETGNHVWWSTHFEYGSMYNSSGIEVTIRCENDGERNSDTALDTR